MKLNLVERIRLGQLLPESGNVANLRILTELRLRLGITEEEHARFKIKADGENIRWDPTVDTTTDIEVGDVAKSIIRDQLLKMDEAEAMTVEHVSLYEKFVEGDNGDGPVGVVE